MVKEEVKRWWKQAKEDIDSANYLFEGKKYKEASFFCQQAAEKALKAALLKKKKKLLKIHDLIKLAKEIGIGGDILDGCERLTAIYIDSRYPDTVNNEYTYEETIEDIATAKNILKWVEKNI